MSRIWTLSTLSLLFVFALIATATPSLSIQATGTGPRLPLWAVHATNFPGGISNAVRSRLDVALQRSASASIASSASMTTAALDNVQMNDETTPDLPVDETQVVLKPSNPMIAIAAANDYVSGGLWIGHTTDGGVHWSTFRAAPVSSTGGKCVGGDPALAWSARDQAFYAVQLCFFFTKADSEVQLWKSVDDGATWTPASSGSTVFTNVASGGTADPTLFYDKEQVVVDNNRRALTTDEST